MTGEEKKKRARSTLLYWSGTSIYYAVSFFGLFFPLLFSVLIAPEQFDYLLHIGMEAGEIAYRWIIVGGYALVAVNVGVLTWHYLIKRRKSDVLKNRLFFYWIFISNICLAGWVLLQISRTFQT